MIKYHHFGIEIHPTFRRFCSFLLILSLLVALCLYLPARQFFNSPVTPWKTTNILCTQTKIKQLPTLDPIDLEIAPRHFQSSHRFYIMDPNHKLLYCYIPKNTCTVFKCLFQALISEQPPLLDGPIHNIMFANEAKYFPSPQFVADKLLNDSSWKSLVILRDPLERLLSGFLNKCKGPQHWCEGANSTEFSDFVDQILYKMNNGEIEQINDHYKPQYMYCELDKFFEHFEYVLYANKSSIADDTLDFMMDANIDDYYFQWGPYHNQTMFVEQTKHANKVKLESFNDTLQFYSKYYDKEMAKKLIQAYYTDYHRFALPYPDWLRYIVTH